MAGNIEGGGEKMKKSPQAPSAPEDRTPEQIAEEAKLAGQSKIEGAKKSTPPALPEETRDDKILSMPTWHVVSELEGEKQKNAVFLVNSTINDLKDRQPPLPTEQFISTLATKLYERLGPDPREYLPPEDRLPLLQGYRRVISYQGTKINLTFGIGGKITVEAE